MKLYKVQVTVYVGMEDDSDVKKAEEFAKRLIEDSTVEEWHDPLNVVQVETVFEHQEPS